MIIKQAPHFKKTYKKLPKNHLSEVNNAIKDICNNPKIGEEKKDYLKGVLVYKFKVKKLVYLLAYECNEVELILLLVLGVHENFYDKLKRNN